MGSFAYAELHCLSNFTFLRGASHPQELVAQAAALGYRALALTDECSLSGIVRAHVAAKAHALHLIVGAQFRLACGLRLVALATDRHGYGRLCRLITRGRRAATKGDYHLTRDDLATTLEHCVLLWLPGEDAQQEQAHWLAAAFPAQVWIAVELLRDGADRARLESLQRLGRQSGLPLVASGDVHMHVRARRRLQDALTAVRLNVPIAQAGRNLYPNGERYLREPQRLGKLYPPELLAETVRIAQRCTFSLDELRYEYPRELVPPGQTPASHLRQLTEAGARWRWPHGVPASERAALEHELGLIGELGYEPYFLTVHDLVAFARRRGILCQGRGSAANSRVCYCLGVTAVDPQRGAGLLFERFISKERDEPPDIDIDFEHERREEVIQYVYAKYGRERAALAATVILYRTRSALRDLGRAFGLAPEVCAQLARVTQGWDAGEALPERLRAAGFDPGSPVLARVLPLARELTAFPGFPRHLSQHVGGLVISAGRLDELVPIENAAMAERTVVQWDKDDLNALGLLKVDVLALGMLSALRKAFDLVNDVRGTRLALGTLPAEDPAVYAMIGRADTVGVFQIESRAQMAMLPRLQPRCYYDLVIEVAIVRPGPIQGDMVHPYLRRRQAKEPVQYPSAEVEAVLRRTLGVPIFQEQVMQLAVAAAGFTPGEADQLRRAMGAWKRSGGLGHLRERLLGGMAARGYPAQFAERIYQQMLGFGEYGFPECLVGETRVLDADTGRWPTIEELICGQAKIATTLACDPALRLRRRRVLAIKASGVKPVWRLRSALGHCLVASAEHPLLTPNGWRTLGRLRVGDQVAAARALCLMRTRRWPRHKLLVLAAVLAAGRPRRGESVHFPVRSRAHGEELAAALERFPNTHAVVQRHAAGLQVRLRPLDRRRAPGALAWLDALGLAGLRAGQQQLPAAVFELRDADIALLIARLWECAGRRSPAGHAVYATGSQRLASELQHLLLRLAIIARVHRQQRMHRGRRLEHYVLTVTEPQSVQRFGRHIGRRYLEPRTRTLWQAAAASARGGAQQHAAAADSQVLWDRIVQIEALGQRQTYDLQIEADHSFLANNLIVHNSHAASFALLVYDSAWLKCHEPAAFAAALLNSQPMGFYAPAQLVRDARAHGVEVRPVDVCVSEWDCTLEPQGPSQPALRLGLRLVKGLSRAGAVRLLEARGTQGFSDVEALARRAGLDRGDLEALAAAGAFAALSGNRHLAFWDVAGVERPLPIEQGAAWDRAASAPGTPDGPPAQCAPRPLLAAPTEGQNIVADYASLGLTLGRHPLALLRAALSRRGLCAADALAGLANGHAVRTAGIVLMRQRPAAAGGVTFVTLEDETGQVNIIVWERIAAAHREALVSARLLEVHGRLQREEGVTHLIARRLIDRTALLGTLLTRSRDFH